MIAIEKFYSNLQVWYFFKNASSNNSNVIGYYIYLYALVFKIIIFCILAMQSKTESYLSKILERIIYQQLSVRLLFSFSSIVFP